MLQRAQQVPSLPTFVFELAAATWVFSTGHLLKTLLSYWLYACPRHQTSLVENIALHGAVTRVWIKSVITMQRGIETIDQLPTGQLKPCVCCSHTRAESRPKNLFQATSLQWNCFRTKNHGITTSIQIWSSSLCMTAFSTTKWCKEIFVEQHGSIHREDHQGQQPIEYDLPPFTIASDYCVLISYPL